MRNEDFLAGVFGGFVIVLVALCLMALSYSVTLRAVVHDCAYMGHFHTQGKSYECKLKEAK